MIRVLGLDTANRQTGVSIRENDRCIQHSTITPPDGTTSEKIEYIRQQLMPIMQQPYTAVVMERTFVQGSGDTTRGLCELQGVIKNYLLRIGHKVYEPSPSTWRAIVPGNGKCDKKAVEEWCNLNQYECCSIDEMEACAIAMSYGEKLIEALTKNERKKAEKKAKKQEKIEAARAARKAAQEKERAAKKAQKEREKLERKCNNGKR